jgi:Fe2+ transport system protein FeoA
MMPSMLSLATVSIGKKVRLESIRGGDKVSHRLTSLGFTPGAEINVVQNYGRGPLIVKVRGSRVALGRGEAQKIIVQGID